MSKKIYGILCERNSIVFGHARAWLKGANGIALFDTYEAADTHCKLVRKSMCTSTSNRYWVKEYTGCLLSSLRP